MNPISIDTTIFTQWIADDGYEIGHAEKSDLANFFGPNKDAYAASGGKSIMPKGISSRQLTNIIDTRPQLFADFSNIQSDTDIVLFANQHGLLLPPASIEVPAGIKYHGDGESTPGERISFWHRQLVDMKLSLQIWELCKKRNLHDLREIIQNQYKGQSIAFDFSYPERYGCYRLPSGDDGRDSDVLFRAKLFVQKTINTKLIEYPVIPTLIIDITDTLKQYFQPSSLISLMWYQFFRYITGEQKLKQCPVCKEWYDIGEKSGNPIWDKRCPMCANRLRVKKNKVKEQYFSGVPVEQIIEHTKKTDSEIIRGWIAEFENTKASKIQDRS